MTKSPLISIITICFNAEKTLEVTLRSVASQLTKDIEYIVIDGGSKDGTLTMLSNYSSTISTLVTEPDQGIYDAMNKGLKLAKGRFINFLNAGDILNSNAINNVLNAAANTNIDIIYSDFILYNSNREILIPGSTLDINKLRRDYTVCHQTLFVARHLAGNYDTSYKIKADYQWTLDIIKKSNPANIIKITSPLVKYLEAGFSERNFRLNLFELIRLHYTHFGLYQIIVNIPVYIYRTLRAFKHAFIDARL